MCGEGEVKGRSSLYRSPESIMREMKNLVKEVGQLLGDNETSDISVNCHGQAILAARSQTFAAGLQNNFIETYKGEWEIKDADTGAVKNMINYIYKA